MLEIEFSEEELAAFEHRVSSALNEGREYEIPVLGYGEVSTVLRMDAAAGPLACKRIPRLPSRKAADKYAGLIGLYIERLGQRGIRVVPTELAIVESQDRSFSLYCIQPVLPPGSLGPDYFATLELDETVEATRRIFELMNKSVDATIAPDGQLSNWSFIEGDIFYLDIGSPFLRDERGNSLLDWGHQISALPPLIRPLVRGKLLHDIIDNYHSLRGQIVDFLGNLTKERLERLTPALMELANCEFSFDPPITRAEVDSYYHKDARTYALMQSLRRADRCWQRKVRRRSYPYFLAPKVDRNL